MDLTLTTTGSGVDVFATGDTDFTFFASDSELGGDDVGEIDNLRLGLEEVRGVAGEEGGVFAFAK